MRTGWGGCSHKGGRYLLEAVVVEQLGSVAVDQGTERETILEAVRGGEGIYYHIEQVQCVAMIRNKLGPAGSTHTHTFLMQQKPPTNCPLLETQSSHQHNAAGMTMQITTTELTQTERPQQIV